MAIRVNPVSLGFGRNRDIQLEGYFQDLGFSYKFWLDIPFKAETYLWAAYGPPKCRGNSLGVTGALCGYETVDNGFHIEYIAAHKNCKGKGVGVALMNQALTDMEGKLEIKTVTLSAVDQYLPLFYAKFGFKTTALRGGITEMKLSLEKPSGGRIHTRRSVRKSRRRFTRSAGRSRKQRT